VVATAWALEAGTCMMKAPSGMGQTGDRLADGRAEWQMIGRPYSTAGGRTVHVRVPSSRIRA
jgi:hypothetical protein